jgi:hypothetical protein
MQEKEAREWEPISRKEEQELFDILTGRCLYRRQPFRQEGIEPDLILKWRLPA